MRCAVADECRLPHYLMLQYPPPVGAIIALPIVLQAVEVLKRDEKQVRLFVRSTWLIAFGFGLLRGLDFAGGLRDIEPPGSNTPTTLVAFNHGVEAGQIAFVVNIIATGSVIHRAFHSSFANGNMPSATSLPQRDMSSAAWLRFWIAEWLAYFGCNTQ